MGMRIATNVSSISAQRFLGLNGNNTSRSLERLSSGSRINRAGDDAAGLAISEKLKANIRSMKQATRNANDGVSMIQVAEGAMNEVSNILIRMRELSIQASSDTIGDTERSFIDKEMQALKSEVDRIATSTDFNGRKLLDGSEANLEIQIGTKNSPLEDRFYYDTTEANSTLSSLGLGGVGTQNRVGAQENLAMIDTALNRLNSNRAGLGALQNRLMSTINNLQISTENLSAANSRIRDTDMAEETSELTKGSILTQANVSVLGQANQSSQLVLKLLS
jgi:flagellin